MNTTTAASEACAREDAQVFHVEVYDESVSEVEGDLIAFLRTGRLAPLPWDDAAFLRDAVSEDGGMTLPGLWRSYQGYRAARRQLCQQLRDYLARVEADEAGRDE